jgi:multiple antibiotic resistance protein
MVEKSLHDFLVFLATIDPVSTLCLFVGFTATATVAERRRLAFRSIGYATVTLLAFLVVGQLLLGALGVRLAAFQLAGALIFLLFGIQMVFGTEVSGSASEPGHDVAVFPLAVPSMASPGAILAAVVLTDNRDHTIAEQAATGLMLVLVLGLTLVALLQAHRIHRVIGNSGASLIVRVLGIILAALAVEMGLEALEELAIASAGAPIQGIVSASSPSPWTVLR